MRQAFSSRARGPVGSGVWSPLPLERHPVMLKCCIPTFYFTMVWVCFAPAAGASGAEKEARWVGGSNLAYGPPDSDGSTFNVACTPEKLAEVDVQTRPPSGKPGQPTRIVFSNRSDTVSYTATLPEPAAYDGENVRYCSDLGQAVRSYEP